MVTAHKQKTALIQTSMFTKSVVFSLGLCALGVVTGARALADSIGQPWQAVATERADVNFLSARDPDEFMSDMAPKLTPSVVLLTREDAVARELLANSRTLSEQQALRTAAALCDEARIQGYDPLLFLAVIHIESYYNHLAVSPVGAEGLMQLMPETAAFLAERGNVKWPDKHSFDPVLNVRLGVRYVADLHRSFDNMDHALTAYNRGPHATRTILRNYGALPETVREFYAGKVLERYRVLVSNYGHLPLT